MTDLTNNKGVCRTAHATLGLLNMKKKKLSVFPLAHGPVMGCGGGRAAAY